MATGVAGPNVHPSADLYVENNKQLLDIEFQVLQSKFMARLIGAAFSQRFSRF